MRKIAEPWVFVSHSNLDVMPVRRLRNALEERQAHPLLFYLKAAWSNDRIRELIFEEIAARHLFVLCDSPHARESNWVQEEVNYVRTLQYKRVVDVDITADWESQIGRIDRLLAEGTVFVSSTITDAERVRPIVGRLTTFDLEVWWNDVNLGGDWARETEEKIKECAQHGVFIQFISGASLFSRWMDMERQIFLKHSGSQQPRLIQILLDPVRLQLSSDSINYQTLDWSNGINQAGLDELIRRIFER